MTTLGAGDTVEGRYRIIRELDRGGMGTVFLAEHQLIKRRVALKILRADLAEDADVLERFMNEARAAGTLGHPNIVESTDMGFTREGVPYIVFEFLEGSLLSDEIYRVRGLPVRRTLRIARQIASALQAAHSAGIIHRDLKTDNIFLTDRDEAADHVKVLDFGISRFLEADDTSGNRSMVIGTPEFMAPEQITAPETVDRRTDVYALGVIIYEMLAARRPFDKNEADPEALFHRIVAEAPPALGVPELPPGLETMLMERFLTKRPDDRFATMQDVEAALAVFAGIVRPVGRDSAPIPIASPMSSVAAAKVVALPAPPKRASVGWLVAALVAGAAGAALLAADPGSHAVEDPNLALLRGDADKIVATVDAAIHASQQRVDGLAQAPMLRAAIETDAATIHDMFAGDFKLQLGTGEAFQLLQQGGTTTLTPMIRIPDGPPLAAPSDLRPRLHATATGLQVVTATQVMTQRGGIGGEIVLTVPVELADVDRQITTHARGAILKGLEAPVTLVAPGQAGVPTDVPVNFAKELAVVATLTATLPPRPPQAHTLAYARIGCWALGGILGIAYLLNLLRARRRG